MNSLRNSKLIFWDFDGVVKESLDAKTKAFITLFQSFGEGISMRVRDHHLANGGMSRLEKIPIYLKWADKTPTDTLIEDYCQRFSKLTLQEVIEAPWVAGVEYILRSNPFKQDFVLVSATPQLDLVKIIEALNLQHSFLSIFGAPIKKGDAIREVLDTYTLRPESTLMIGDALADMEAAKINGVPFLLRRHSLNEEVFQAYSGDFIYNFENI